MVTEPLLPFLILPPCCKSLHGEEYFLGNPKIDHFDWVWGLGTRRPKLVRELFRVADEHAPSIVFIDEIDAVGTKRYDSTSGGEKEIQRTMLELLNQLDGFDARSDVKVIMAGDQLRHLLLSLALFVKWATRPTVISPGQC
jgi:hypothetical protein